MIHWLATADKISEGIPFDLDVAYDSYGCDNPVGFDDPSFMPNPIYALDFILSDDVEPIGVKELSDLRRDANDVDLHSSSINESLCPNDTIDMSESDNLTHDDDCTTRDNLGNECEPTCSNEMIHQQNEEAISVPTDAASLATDDDNSESNEEDGVIIADVATEMDALSGERNLNYRFRTRSRCSYVHLFAQMGFKAGLRKFRKKVENAVKRIFSTKYI